MEVYQEELEIQNEELRRFQSELKDLYGRYVDLYDFAPAGYLTLDALGDVKEANLTAATLLGRDRASIVGHRLAMFFIRESRITLQQHLKQVLSAPTSQNCELIFNKPDGSQCEVRIDSNQISTEENGDNGDNGELKCRIVMTDITLRKQVERESIAQERFLKSVTNALPVLIAHVDRELRLQFTNAAYQDWFGPHDFHGQHLGVVLGEVLAAEIEDYAPDVLSGRRVDFETTLQHRTKGLRHVQSMLVPDFSLSETATGIHALCIDITERKIVEEQNSRRRKFSERLERLLPNEKEVYELLVRGKANKVIALDLDIGLRTVERRRQTVLEKLGVETVTDLLHQLAYMTGTVPHQ
jgi:PAS domain S-box-containing protein